MAGLTIKCPQCNARMRIRDSERMTNSAIHAVVYCDDCAIRAKVFAQIDKIERAEYRPFKTTRSTDQAATNKAKQQ